MEECIKLSKKSKCIQHLLNVDERLSLVIRAIGEITYTIHQDPFGFLVNTIIGQMLSNKVKDIIWGRFISLCEGTISPKSILNLSNKQMRLVGISENKIEYIINLAYVISNNPNFFRLLDSLDDASIIKELTKIKGIGPWSSKMYLIFILDRQDILPLEDRAFLQAFSWLYNLEKPTIKEIKQYTAAWRPYSSIASRYLYHALDKGYTKTNIEICTV